MHWQENHFQNRSRGFLSTGIPLWLFLTSLIVLGTSIATWYLYLREPAVYSYSLSVPIHTNATTTLHYGATPALANANYFLKFKNSLIEQNASFIEADLSTMKLTVYENGTAAKEVPIITKGREGSWWETPAGIYKIETKEKSHFSSMGKVYQPWSMQFQGNFFIHGWPYYQDGTPVATSYSGGCVRLRTDDAKAIFDLVNIGTPVLVYEKDFGSDSFTYNLKQPPIDARSYLVADLKNDSILFQKSITDQAPIASVTKLITALVVSEYVNLDKNLTIAESDIASTSKPRLRAGKTYSAYNLLFPFLMESSNEIANTFARQLGKNRFIDLMNQKAQALGMETSHFVDPAGIDADNVSTPQDLFALAKYLYNNRSFVLKISSGTLTSSAYGTPVFQGLRNFNIIPNAAGTFIGGKIGKTTAAGETYVGIFEISVRGENRPIAVIVLDSKDVYKDVKLMLDYIYSTYTE